MRSRPMHKPMTIPINSQVQIMISKLTRAIPILNELSSIAQSCNLLTKGHTPHIQYG
jgi:hypothetical protein